MRTGPFIEFMLELVVCGWEKRASRHLRLSLFVVAVKSRASDTLIYLAWLARSQRDQQPTQRKKGPQGWPRWVMMLLTSTSNPVSPVLDNFPAIVEQWLNWISKRHIITIGSWQFRGGGGKGAGKVGDIQKWSFFDNNLYLHISINVVE